MTCINCNSIVPENSIVVFDDNGTSWQCPKCHSWNLPTNFIEFVKHDNGKIRYGLIPPLAEREMAAVLTFGAQKYSVDNWRNVDDLNRYVDAALRHISAYRMGEFRDSETGLHHLAHAMCCLSFIVDIEIGAAPINGSVCMEKEISSCQGCAYKGITYKGCFDCIEGSQFKEEDS